jgi:hypothetical protein
MDERSHRERPHTSLLGYFSVFRRETSYENDDMQELGGKCGQKLSAGTWDQMVQAMTEHVMEKHLDVAKEMEKMHKEDPEKWGKEMRSFRNLRGSQGFG